MSERFEVEVWKLLTTKSVEEHVEDVASAAGWRPRSWKT